MRLPATAPEAAPAPCDVPITKLDPYAEVEHLTVSTLNSLLLPSESQVTIVPAGFRPATSEAKVSSSFEHWTNPVPQNISALSDGLIVERTTSVKPSAKAVTGPCAGDNFGRGGMKQDPLVALRRNPGALSDENTFVAFELPPHFGGRSTFPTSVQPVPVPVAATLQHPSAQRQAPLPPGPVFRSAAPPSTPAAPAYPAQSASMAVPAGAVNSHHSRTNAGLPREYPDPRAHLEHTDNVNNAEKLLSNQDAHTAHIMGMCKPCIFFHKCECMKTRCNFCHFRHSAQEVKRVHPCKSTRRCLQRRVRASAAAAAATSSAAAAAQPQASPLAF